jgi:chromate reductase
MSAIPKILALSGSTRTGSLNKKLLRIVSQGAEAAGAQVTTVDLRELALPLYDGDLEEREGLPPGARRLKDLMLEHGGLLIASPEYNSTFSAVLKNAIDWATRPAPGEKPLECFVDKVAGLVSASPGALGGLRGLLQLRYLLSNIGVIVLPDQVAIPKADAAFDADGQLTDPRQAEAVRAVGARVATFLRRLSAGQAAVG